MKIRVPGTSANLGCGFDSCGISLSLYLYLDVKGQSKDWYIEHDIPNLPHDKTNLVIQTALKVNPDLIPHHITMISEIPTARGLGSSSSAIVAGIELANRLGNMGLTQRDKLQFATEMEGHPDNVAPAIFGGFVVASYSQGLVESVKHYFPECRCVVYIPANELLTSESRGVLPNTLSYKEAVEASAISNVMIAAVASGDLVVAGRMMEQDLWHEKYRGALIPHLGAIRELGHRKGVYGTVLSGAGPTILTLCPIEKTEGFVKELNELSLGGRVEVFDLDSEGVQTY